VEEKLNKLSKAFREFWGGSAGEKMEQEKMAFIRAMLADYSKALGLPEADILAAIEGKRDYSAANYYQEAKFPSLAGVRVFDTQSELLASIPSRKFRCSACGGISTNPYGCNAPAREKGKKCNWKANGLFRTAGKGFRFTIKEGFLDHPKVDVIFMPVDFEEL
jgi:hypothetical protein